MAVVVMVIVKLNFADLANFFRRHFPFLHSTIQLVRIILTMLTTSEMSMLPSSFMSAF